MRKQLTEVEAWNRIARKIQSGHWDHYGLCSEVASLENAHAVSWQTAEDMTDRIRAHMTAFHAHDGYGMYFDVLGLPGARVLAALLLALEASDELAPVEVAS